MTRHNIHNKDNEMNFEEMKIGDLMKVVSALSGDQKTQSFDNGMNGKYVIVRCRGAGVHAGIQESHGNGECVLSESRRLWYWKCGGGKSFLSGVAAAGLETSSKVGVENTRTHLTEVCETIECTDEARKSISGLPEFSK